jgi:biotin synthase
MEKTESKGDARSNMAGAPRYVSGLTPSAEPQSLPVLELPEASIRDTVEAMAARRRAVLSGDAPAPVRECLSAVRAGRPVEAPLAKAVAAESVWDVIALAWIVNDERGPQESDAHLCTGSYGLSESCAQGCTMCSFSGRSDEPALISNPEFSRTPEQFVEVARKQVALARAHNPKARIAFKVTHIGMGLRGNPGLRTRYVEVLKAVREVEGIDFVDACLGLLDWDSAQAIAPFVHKYNNNLERIQRPGEAWVTDQHTLQDKIDTLRMARRAGMGVCSGLLFGAGETVDDKIEGLTLLRQLVAEGTVGSSPINAFVPVYASDLELIQRVPETDVILGLALARLLLPNHPFFPNAGRYRYGTFLPAMHALASGYSSHHNYLTKFISADADRASLRALKAARG